MLEAEPWAADSAKKPETLSNFRKVFAAINRNFPGFDEVCILQIMCFPTTHGHTKTIKEIASKAGTVDHHVAMDTVIVLLDDSDHSEHIKEILEVLEGK